MVHPFYKMTSAFVVGNGSSLRETPLELLNDHVSWGCNRINLIYKDTSWRPTHYIRIETPNDDNADDFWNDCTGHLEMGVQCFFPPPFRFQWPKNNWPNLNIFPCDNHWRYANRSDGYRWPTSWHGKLGPICSFGSVVTAAIQLINRDPKFKRIVLVGCDMDYGDGDDHFYDSSSEQRQPAAQALAVMQHAHALAARSSGLPIYNATLGGKLETYERIDFEEAIKRENMATW